MVTVCEVCVERPSGREVFFVLKKRDNRLQTLDRNYFSKEKQKPKKKKESQPTGGPAESKVFGENTIRRRRMEIFSKTRRA